MKDRSARGIPALLTQYEARRDPIDCAPGEALPEADADLARLTRTIVEDPDEDPDFAPPFRSGFHRKSHAIRKELQGLSELCSLHGLLVAHLRKRGFPDHAPYLFHRLWDEHADHLLEHLDSRWLVSAITTFGDHGLTPTQRSTGLALSTLFGAMKLYETERLYSGFTPQQPFPSSKRQKAALPLDMDAYALVGGGLDVNLIARLWQEASEDLVIAPLAHDLLAKLLNDDRALPARLAAMRAEKEAHRATRKPEPDGTPQGNNPAPVNAGRVPATAADLRWGLVTTVKAPLDQIARFAAHHLDLGAEALHLYLDVPNPQAAAFLGDHPKIRVTTCDAAYWESHGKARPDAHQLRQAFNATRCYHAHSEGLHWLGHIDVDEFILADTPVALALHAAAPDAAIARIAPAEALATDGPPQHFKLTHKQAGVKKADLQDVYPTFGLHLYGGFLSHTSGKVFARTGIADTRLGIHTLKFRGQDATNKAKPAGLLLAHLHAASWEKFRNHLDFRLARGSYRKRSTRPELGQADLFAFLMEEEGESGLRAFFDEVCADTPDLRARLADKGMLVTRDLDLEAKVARIFGPLP